MSTLFFSKCINPDHIINMLIWGDCTCCDDKPNDQDKQDLEDYQNKQDLKNYEN